MRVSVTTSMLTTKPPARAGGFERLASATSDHADVLRFVTLAARGYVELDVLALFEGLVALALDVRVVDEDILLSLERDEAEALLGIEKFHCSCSQLNGPSLALGEH